MVEIFVRFMGVEHYFLPLPTYFKKSKHLLKEHYPKKYNLKHILIKLK